MVGPDEEYPGGWFGPAPFAPVCEDSPHRATPVGEPCLYCGKVIVEGDEGLLIPGERIADDGTIIYVIYACHIACFRQGLRVR